MFREMTTKRTLTTDELLVEFTGDLPEAVRQLGDLVRGFSRTYPPDDDLWWCSAAAFEEYQTLVERMNERAPEGYYFGGHPLQPQCLGFWPTY